MYSKNYIAQRLSAVLLIPLTLLFTWFICQLLHQGSAYFIKFIQNGFNILWLTLFVLIALYHAIFGLDSIISDYITNKVTRYVIWVFLLASYATTICAFIFAMFRLNSLI